MQYVQLLSICHDVSTVVTHCHQGYCNIFYTDYSGESLNSPTISFVLFKSSIYTKNYNDEVKRPQPYKIVLKHN